MAEFHFLNKTQPPQVTKLNLPENTSCVLLKKRNIVVKPKPMPILQPDGVLVKVVATDKFIHSGKLTYLLIPSRICGSDLHNYLAGGVGGRPVTEPIVMGHESSGEVIAVGDLVKTHKVGDRVAIEPGLPCRRCINCKEGKVNICLNMHYCGAPGSVGSLSRYFALPADMAPHIPDHLSWEEAGCIQPLAVGIQVGKRVDLGPHKTVAIFGCGPIGLISAAVAHAYSARKIIAFDNNPQRVEFAKKYISPLTGKPIIDHVFLVKDLPTSSLRDSHASGNGNMTNGQTEALAHALGETGSGAGMGDGEMLDEDHEETIGDKKWEWAKKIVAGFAQEAGLTAEEGVDRVVEATGAEDCMLMGIAIAKQGGNYLAVGLGHIQTNCFPTLAVTNKEINVMGITRYTASCFPSALDLLSRGVVDVKQLITKTFPLTQSTEAFEAVAAGQDIKVVIKNQEGFDN
ncbi:Xylitol dehydrogenase, putative [Cryptococcus gattii WM276]|uniref:Xylitol dehydrogenase, putative n=1 Tax=Cryptococcus gattii serotype B (strain WM276 / ATCC MYA-4071) TaxID=367775 RepID=E6R2N5_CRYGW|nr:Xylitol dehydrogenase, putative [Cryptococcus gattii WM276]ADV20758.1 Xylitol dehydrogenase, putative [Cryptococcus gattii WM276]KJE03591.1 xylitol dehydrogenase [Cryptococcus gattii NT-10]